MVEAIIGLLVLLAPLALMLLTLAGMWTTYVKANQPGWAAIIPIYNIWVLLKIVDRPGWWLVLFFIPLVNLIIGILVILDLAKTFGKGIGFALGLLFFPFIFYPLLGFGDARYQKSTAY